MRVLCTCVCVCICVWCVCVCVCTCSANVILFSNNCQDDPSLDRQLVWVCGCVCTYVCISVFVFGGCEWVGVRKKEKRGEKGKVRGSEGICRHHQ